MMLFSELLLLAFMCYWVYNQYKNARSDFQQALAVEFDESQRQISDSLLMGHFKEHALPAAKINTVNTNDSNGHQPQNTGIKIAFGPKGNTVNYYKIEGTVRNDTKKISQELEHDSTRSAFISQDLPGNDVQVVNIIYRNLKFFADSNSAALFRNDTSLFNKEFSRKMKDKGWGIHIKWTEDSAFRKDNKRFYIKSDYFTNSYGVEVSHFSWYLLKKVSPQILFTLALLIITGLAFRFAYKSLKEQIMLGTLKNDFISNMSHELKTPVSTIKVALEALETYNVIADREKAKDYLEMANLEMKRLDLLINQALNSSLLEDGKIAFHNNKEDLEAVTSEVLDILRVRFNQQQAIISFEHTGSNFDANVDKLHIQGVLINILDNCLKYAGAAPSITVSITELENELQIAVADNGPGIPKEYIDKIFEKFFRVPTGDEHNIKGYGLGLSYAAQVMQQHGGSIKVANLATGGSIFTLSFPKYMA